MKTAAIYNVFDGTELLIHSMRSLKDGIDSFIIVWQGVSNHGELYYPFQHNTVTLSEIETEFPSVTLINFSPDPKMSPGRCETLKRQLGIEQAKKQGCTHFILMDCDEFYQDFKSMKDDYIQSGCTGSVAPIYTYFKLPTLRLEHYDNYFVPFIHLLEDNTVTGHKDYQYYVDPTRRIKTESVCLMDSPMHHYSWVRKDIKRKVNNSTARVNILKSKLVEDYYNPNIKEGSTIRDYQNQKLIIAEDLFGLSKVFN